MGVVVVVGVALLLLFGREIDFCFLVVCHSSPVISMVEMLLVVLTLLFLLLLLLLLLLFLLEVPLLLKFGSLITSRRKVFSAVGSLSVAKLLSCFV